MNIVMLMHYFWPRGGGEERHGRFLGRELVKRGHKVTFVVAAYDPALPESDEIDGVQIQRISEQHLRNLGFAQRYAWFRRHRDLLDSADLVHCHDPITVTRWYFLERLIRRGLRTYMTVHGYDAYPVPTTAKVERAIACRRVRKVISVADLRCFYPGSRVDRIIYGAADLGADPGRPPEAPARYSVFIGRLAPGHNPVGIVTANAQWRSMGGNPPPLLLFGDGPLKNETLAAIEDTGIDARLMGRTEEPECWMRHADISFSGGYLSLIESMSAGVGAYALDNDPVLAECWRQIPVDGFVHAPDPRSLGEALWADEQDPMAARERVARGQAWASQQTWSHMADVYEEVWGL